MELNNVEIIKIGEVQTFAKDFRKVEFIVKDDSGQYQQEIQFNILKDKIDNFLQYNKVGDRVNISFNLNGKSWLKDGEDESKRRWFNSLDAWMVKKADAQSSNTTVTPQEAFEPVDLSGDNNSELPF